MTLERYGRTGRGRNWRKADLLSTISMPRTLREMTSQQSPKPLYRRFDRRHWLHAERENLCPLPLWVFRTPGGRAALTYFDAWAQVELARRASGDASAMPAREGGKGAIGEGFSLPSVCLKAMSIGKWLEGQEPWVRMLLAFIFIDGWEPLRREVAYYLPNARTEQGIRVLEQRVRRWEKLAILPVARLANARKEIQALRESSIIVLGGDEPPPVQAQADRTLIVRRWTFELAEFDWRTDLFEMPRARRKATLERDLLDLSLSVVTALRLGRTTPQVVEVDVWDTLGWSDGGIEWR